MAGPKAVTLAVLEGKQRDSAQAEFGGYSPHSGLLSNAPVGPPRSQNRVR